MNKIFIFAIDCLDYRLIERFGLNVFKQNLWGTMDVSEFGGEHCLTPALWGSFISGKSLKDLEWYVYDNKLLQFIMTFSKRAGVKKNVDCILNRLKLKSRFKRHLISSSDLNIRTIFEIITPSISLYIPSYNDEQWYHHEYDIALKKGAKQLEKVVMDIHELKYKETLERLNSDWNLFMVWFDVIDLFSHICYPKRLSKLKNVYSLVLDQVEDLKSFLSNDTITLVVNDHGINEKGLHNPVGFWSLNTRPSIIPRKITDFYSLLINMTKFSFISDPQKKNLE